MSRLKSTFLNACLEVHLALFVGILMFVMSFLLAGCWSTKKLPPPATTDTLCSAESRLDYLGDKRLSRISSAISVALEEDEAISNPVIKGELSIAKALAGEATYGDLEWASNRASKNSEEYYLSQLEDSRKLIAEINEANKVYEAEKARKDAEYKAGIAQREMELKAEREAHEADKWTWTGIGLFVFGVASLYFGSSIKQKAFGALILVSGIVAGSVPAIQKESWFKSGVGGLILFIILSAIAYGIWYAKKSKNAELSAVTNEKNDTSSSDK